MTLVKVNLNRYNQAPRKTRLLIDLIRGKDVSTALGLLSLTPKRASLPLTKLLKSAVSDAKHNFKMGEEELFIKEARVDGGVVMKRGMPRAFGRAFPVRKRTSNISLVLSVKK